MADAQEQGKPAAGSAPAAAGSMLDEIMVQTKMKPSDEGYDVAKKGVQAFIAQQPAPAGAAQKADTKMVDSMIAEIDTQLVKQINQVLRADKFQKLEAACARLKL